MAKTIWTLADAKARHRHSVRLAEALIQVLPIDVPVLDLGCGPGFYLGHLSRAGYRCLGVEGTPGIAEIAFFPEIIQADLAQPLNLEWPQSSVLCLEVAEHLLPDQEEQLISTIDSYCSRLLILSWAVPGQRGTGHNNCRTNDYVCQRMRERGLELLPEPTQMLRAAADRNTQYFRQTLQVFARS